RRAGNGRTPRGTASRIRPTPHYVATDESVFPGVDRQGVPRRSGHCSLVKRQPGLPPQLLGIGMMAYYGGRAECRIRREVAPVLYCDFLSMYPTVNALLELWRLLSAQSVLVVDATDDIQGL